MSTADQLLDSMTDEELELYTADADTEPHIVIGKDRFITVPEELKRIAVQFDHNVETVIFDCPRYWDEHDLSNMIIYINYMRKDGYMDSYPADNLAVDASDDKLIHFSWTISSNVSEIKGDIRFLVCAKITDEDGNEETHWNSELNEEMYVSEGLECVENIINKYPDIVTQLLVRMDVTEEKTTEEMMTKFLVAYLENDKGLMQKSIERYVLEYLLSTEPTSAESIERYINNYISSHDPFFVVGNEKPKRKCLWFNTGGTGTGTDSPSNAAMLSLNEEPDEHTVFAEIDETTYGVDNATIEKIATKENYNFTIV